MKPKAHILPIIILSQFACTSLWFAGNAIVDELALRTASESALTGYVLSAVQLGFIVGTLVFAIFMLADRFSPARVFFGSAIIAAAFNLLLLAPNLSIPIVITARFGTGFFLAGIYPVGMKIAADYYEKGLGKALGYLVGALVLGTALPHLLNSTSLGSEANTVICTVSILSVFGGLLLWILVPDGPYQKRSQQLQLHVGPQLFKIQKFKIAALGYFGHMWELYAFWAFTPLAFAYFNQTNQTNYSVSLATGLVIALGGFSCAIGGIASQKLGSGFIAEKALFGSGLCCLLSPLFFMLSFPLFVSCWCLWGMCVTADSPQFSSLVASAVTPQLKGTGLTLVNCIGFAISIISIQMLDFFSTSLLTPYLFLILAVGPLIGLWQLRQSKF